MACGTGRAKLDLSLDTGIRAEQGQIGMAGGRGQHLDPCGRLQLAEAADDVGRQIVLKKPPGVLVIARP